VFGVFGTANGDTGATPDRAEPGEPLLVLPALGNTAEDDLPLLREIGDEHVHGLEDGLAPLPAAPLPEDVWTRVSTAGRLQIPNNESVRARVRALRDEAPWMSKTLYRGTPFVAHIVTALEARFLPPELALLPAIESGFRPHARSVDAAVGLWQIVPLTAREIGVEWSDWYDGRIDIVASTRAALDYLSYLNAEFHGDWELTLAAYNAGPGRVRQAIGRNRAAGRAEDFWSLELPAETRAYVPKLLGLLALLREGDGGFDVPWVPLEPAFVKVDVGRRISLEQAAAIGGLPERELRRLNAGLTRGVTPPAGPHELYVPRGTEEAFLGRLGATVTVPDRRPARANVHVVLAGDTLGEIALEHGLSETRLKTLNDLEGSLIRVGQRLRLRDTLPADDRPSLEHVVVHGDTLSAIARQHGVTIEDITDRHGRPLRADLIRVGETLRVRGPPSDT